MKATLRFILAAALFTALSPVLSAQVWQKKSKLVREKGAIYLEEFLSAPLKLKVLKAANAYSTVKGKRYLGTIRAGQTVTVLAVHDRAFRVRGIAQQGQIVGWIGPTFLEKTEPDFVENLKKAHARAVEVAELIARKEVALGMNMDEVEASLGRPTKKSSQVNKEGRTDTYEYISYKRVPQTHLTTDRFGRVYRSTTYLLVETGKVSIDFTDDVVVSISESERNPRDRIRAVPAPIIVF